MSHTTPGAKSETAPNKKDLWRTTDLAFADAQELCGVEFALDAAASEGVAKCPMHYTPEQNALNQNWFMFEGLGVWCNPPFSLKSEFLDKAFEESSRCSLICMMIPFEPATKWWAKHVMGKATVVYIPDGRYNFLEPETGEEIKGVPFASCFAVFTGLTMPTQYVHFERGIGSTDAQKKTA